MPVRVAVGRGSRRVQTEDCRPTMTDFEVYIDDARYSVPSLYLISAASEALARATAEGMLAASEHHQGVELRRDGETIYGLGSFAVLGAATGGSAEVSHV
jgi:hypothetical protein